eukprot:g59019.t1
MGHDVDLHEWEEQGAEDAKLPSGLWNHPFTHNNYQRDTHKMCLRLQNLTDFGLNFLFLKITADVQSANTPVECVAKAADANGGAVFTMQHHPETPNRHSSNSNSRGRWGL